MVTLALAFTAMVHGTVASVDRAHDLVVVYHRAHAGMRANMTMTVRMRDPRSLRALKRGEVVRLSCDETVRPWVCVRR